MRLRSVGQVAEEVRETAGRVGQSAQWNTIAMISITLVSLVALMMATLALVVAT